MTLGRDPVHEIEHNLAAEIARVAGRHIGRGTPRVQVHFRDDTIVYLVECPELAQAGSEVIERLDRSVDDILRQRLGRGVAGTPSRTHLSPQSRLVVLRLD